MSRLTVAVRRHGPAGLPAAIARRAAASARERAERRAEAAFDRERAIDTAGVVRDGATPYQPVHPAAFAEFLTHLGEVDRRATTFVDVGSGRGRAVFLAIEHGFGAAVGIELEASHHRIALENLRRYRRPRAEAISLQLGDARSLALPPGPVVLFVYNPFGRAVMESFAAHLERALAGPAWVIYEAPLDRDLFDARPCFELVAERMERAGASPRRPRFVIYRATSSAARRRSA